MAGRRLPALCGGGRAATTRVRRKRAACSSSPASKLAVAALASGAGNKASSKGGSPGGVVGGCYVDGNGALMVEVGGAGAAGARKKKKDGGGRRVMVLADGRAEAAGALQWALSQAVRSNDTVVLLAVVKPLAQDAVSDSCVKMLGTKSQQHLDALRTLCESTRPEVKVETCAVEAEERAPAVVEAARRHGASLLVLGQRRRRAVARWLQALWRRRRRRRGGSGSPGGMVEYCIEHAPCVALAVRRRSSGGYLLCCPDMRIRIPTPEEPKSSPMATAASTTSSDGGGLSRSASAIVAVAESGQHLLRIDGYSHTMDVPTGSDIKSPPFSVGGHSCCISYYPNGLSSAWSDYISLFLQLDGGAPQDVWVRHTFSLLGREGKPVPYFINSGKKIFTDWGTSAFIRRSELEGSEHLRGNSFTIRCNVTVTKEIQTKSVDVGASAAPTVAPLPPDPDLHRHLAGLLATGEATDVVFEVDDKTFMAHRCVLCCSNYS
ncbi:uncharacterized protein LOC120688790 [Panicum virgatum]|uniref:uncharacterized protein LOC120688790 n=1 Tax=Panicum virgatum TaxID=38727 RepID=UPI0019D67747|nr:uncharacterized protein LOC120688790 [Panicum virgatum]